MNVFSDALCPMPSAGLVGFVHNLTVVGEHSADC